MMAVRARPAIGAQFACRSYAPALMRIALLAAVGVELAVLAAWLPDTLRALWRGDSRDFHNLYQPARHLGLVGLYSPALSPLLFPVTLLGEHVAYRIVFCAGAASAIAIAYVAQRQVASVEARAAVALAVLSLPELHWALRLGHITPMLALAALAGFMLASRRPRVAGVLLSLMLLKPQTAVAPFLYLAVRRQFRAVMWMLGAAGGAAAVGFAVIGPASVATFAGYLVNWGPHSTENLLPVQQAWMYSWPGFLVSVGVHPNPLVTADLLLLSAAVTGVAVARLDAKSAAAAGAMAMILLTPYSQFYDSCLLAVAFVLVLRAPIAPWLRGLIIAALYAAAVVTQANTYFPVHDVLGPAETGGPYWLTPALLVAIAAIALFARRAGNEEVRDGR